jgi:hypothetical protein
VAVTRVTGHWQTTASDPSSRMTAAEEGPWRPDPEVATNLDMDPLALAEPAPATESPHSRRGVASGSRPVAHVSGLLPHDPAVVNRSMHQRDHKRVTAPSITSSTGPQLRLIDPKVRRTYFNGSRQPRALLSC